MDVRDLHQGITAKVEVPLITFNEGEFLWIAAFSSQSVQSIKVDAALINYICSTDRNGLKETILHNHVTHVSTMKYKTIALHGPER